MGWTPHNFYETGKCIVIIYDYINDYIRKTIKRNEGILSELEGIAEEQHIPIIQPEVAQLLLIL